MRRLILILILASLTPLAACSGGAESPPGPTPTPLPGTVLEPPRDLPDFTLTAHTGDPIHLSDLQGRVVMLFFGFTHCPDVCPTALSEFKRVKTQLGEEAAGVAFVFVSVDGARDTPERLAEYLGHFDPDFIGMTGPEDEIRTIGRDYGLFFQRSSYDADDYLVDHTASTFVINPAGQLAIIYPAGTDPAIMAEGVRRLLAG